MEICYGLFLLTASLAAAGMIENRLLLGLTGTLHVGTRVIGNVWFGRLSDRIGRKQLLKMACVLCGLSFLALRLATPGAVFLAYFLSGVANSAFWPIMEAWIGDEEIGADLLRSLGAFGVVFTAGIATGSLLGGYFERLSSIAATLAGCLMLIPIGVLIAGTPDDRHPGAAAGDPGENAPPPKMRRRFLMAAWLANFATWFTIGLQRFIFARLCLESGLSKPAIGWINAALYLSWATTFLLLTRFRFWTYRRAPLLAFQALGALAAGLIWLLPSAPAFLLGFALFGVSAGLTYFSSMFYGQHGAAERGHRSGLHEMILGLGMLVGPLIGGVLAQAYELRTPFLAAALAIVAAMGGVVIAIGRRETSIGSEEPHRYLLQRRGGKDLNGRRDSCRSLFRVFRG